MGFALLLLSLAGVSSAFVVLNSTSSLEQIPNQKCVNSSVKEEINSQYVDAKIIGGTKVTSPKSYPYQVRIAGGCAASLIHKKWVLTAAHCVHKKRDRQHKIYIQMGSILRSGGDCKICKSCKRCEKCKRCKRNRVRVRVCRIMVHKDWDGNMRHGNDIALMELKEPAPLRDTIRTIRLPCGLKNHNFHGKFFKATGWGTTDGNRKYSNSRILRMVKLPFVQRGTPNCCVRDNIICAGTRSKVNRNKAVCRGDYGGPLAYSIKRKTYIVGISSYHSVHSCSGVSKFTRVTSFIKWIEDKTGVDFCRGE